MNAYFYCSYKLSQRGFQTVVLNAGTSDEAQTEWIKRLMINSGIVSAAGKEADQYYFVIKNIVLNDPNLDDESVGKVWYINFGLTADKLQLPDLCACAYYALTDTHSFAEDLKAALSVTNDPNGYSVDAVHYAEVVETAKIKYADFCSSGDVEFISAPADLSQDSLNGVLNLLKNGDLEDRIAFAMLPRSKDYFFKLLREQPSEICEPVYINSVDNGASHPIEPHLISTNDSWFLDNRKIVLAGATVFVVIGTTVALANHFKKKRFRRFF